MLVSITGTPGVGKTTVSKMLEREGWNRIDLRELIVQEGWSDEFDDDTGELIVDIELLKDRLEGMEFTIDVDTVIDGHLSYLAPTDICIVLRLDPRELGIRLKERSYPPEKIRDNLESEVVSVILVEASELEYERLKGTEWTDLPEGAGTLFEIDTTGRTPESVFGVIMLILNGYRGKRLNELVEYRPGKVDWLEVSDGWS
jgi:adenylate kinase